MFPPETKHPEIGDLSIGEFTGDRNEDKKLYLEVLEEEYHKEFTHAGGHSRFKEDVEC